jgi:hypothetical protein
MAKRGNGQPIEGNDRVIQALEERIEELKTALSPFRFDGVLLSGVVGATFNYQVPEAAVAAARRALG